MVKNQKLKAFHYKGLKIYLHPEVYEPSDDTFQLLEAIIIKKREKILEIGAGCGIIALECARLGADVICTDLNPYAIEITMKNYNQNKSLLKGDFEARFGDMFSVVKNKFFNVVIFNPPYLPTTPNDKVGGTGWFDISTDGGYSGLEVTNRLIENVGRFLFKDGRVYFVFSSLSDRKKLENRIVKYNFKYDIICSKKYYDEIIDIYKIYF